MNFEETKIKGAYLIKPNSFSDNRGEFFRVACRKELSAMGLEKEIVQTNISINYKSGTLRGMHFQKAPALEAKIITCISGSVFDVLVDLRKGSSTFLQWIGVELTAETKQMIYIPEGCAHGFVTLTDHANLLYHHTAYYTKECEGAFRYDDPLVGIVWPVTPSVISDRDAAHPYLSKQFNGLKYEL